MASRTFDVVDVVEILVHWHAGRSLNEMSSSLGVDRKTIRKYIAPGLAAGLEPGSGPPRSETEWQKLVREWFPPARGRLQESGRCRRPLLPDRPRHPRRRHRAR